MYSKNNINIYNFAGGADRTHEEFVYAFININYVRGHVYFKTNVNTYTFLVS